mgnify:CR=1 FL=1
MQRRYNQQGRHMRLARTLPSNFRTGGACPVADYDTQCETHFSAESCVSYCDTSAPGWVAINWYDSAFGCCCLTECACTQSTGTPGLLIAKDAAALPTGFCPDSSIWTDGTFKRKKKYTGYAGLDLEEIIAMMFASMVAAGATCSYSQMPKDRIWSGISATVRTN